MSIKIAVTRTGGNFSRIGGSFCSLPSNNFRTRLLQQQEHRHHHIYTNAHFSRLRQKIGLLLTHHRSVVVAVSSCNYGQHHPPLLPLHHGSPNTAGGALLLGSIRTITHYERLKIKPPSNEKEIKLAYFQRAKESHPDLHKGDEKKKHRKCVVFVQFPL